MNNHISKRPLDKIDHRILDELTRDSRLPIATLAERVTLSRNAVRKRIEHLERDNVIAKYTIQRGDGRPQQDKTVALIMIDRRDRMRGSDVTSALKKIPEVRLCYVVSGRADLIIQVEAEGAERLREICSEIWKIPGVIDTRTNIVLSSLINR